MYIYMCSHMLAKVWYCISGNHCIFPTLNFSPENLYFLLSFKNQSIVHYTIQVCPASHKCKYNKNLKISYRNCNQYPNMLLLLPLGQENMYSYLGVCKENNTARAQSAKGKGRISLLLLYFGACLNNLPQSYVAFAVLCCIDSTLCTPTWLQDGSCTYTRDSWSTVGALQSPRAKSPWFTESVTIITINYITVTTTN